MSKQPKPAKTAEAHYWHIHEEIAELHKLKGADLGDGKDPLANLRGVERFGMKPWVHCVVQVDENLRRIQAFIRNGVLGDPACQIQNALIDAANYSMLALAFYREENDG